MGAGEDDGETTDIHSYVKEWLSRSDVDRTDPVEVRNIVMAASTNYILHTDPTEIDDSEYHYLTAIRFEQLVSEGKAMYEHSGNETFAKLSEVLDKEDAMTVAERHGRFAVGNHVTLMYSMAYEFVGDMLERLLPKILADDVDDAVVSTLQSQLNGYQSKTDVLAQAGIIDDETAATVHHIRQVRSDLVHDIEKRFTLPMLDDLNEMNRVQEVMTDLFEEVYGFPAYQYVD